MFRETAKARVVIATGKKLSPEEEMLVESMAAHIQTGWWKMAMDKGGDIDYHYEQIQEEHRKKAVGAMVAVLEVLGAVGRGKRMPDEYIEMFFHRMGASS